MILLIEIIQLLFCMVLVKGNIPNSKYHVKHNTRIISNTTSSLSTNSSIRCAIACLQSEKCCSTQFNRQNRMCTLTHFGGLQKWNGMTDDSMTMVTATRPSVDPPIQDCTDLSICFTPGVYSSGVYTIHARRNMSFDVYCDMDTDGGGWTVFQRRTDGTTDFYRGWTEYELGFGNLTNEFWLGNSKINTITSSGTYKLRIDLDDFEGNTRFAVYSSFSVGDADSNYTLSVSGYSGDAGDSLQDTSLGDRQPDGMSFSTFDRDNDNTGSYNCALYHKGAWWYNSCHQANLNGEYATTAQGKGVNWYHWKGYSYSLKSTKMMIKRK